MFDYDTLTEGLAAIIEENDLFGEPFVRGTTSAQGTGLGLSIVRSIMDQTGGSLTLHSPASNADEGFEAAITLPG